MSIERKTLSQLIDEAWTTNMKLWRAQETVMGDGTEAEVAAAAKEAQRLNARRTALMKAIDERANDGGFSPTDKTYAGK